MEYWSTGVMDKRKGIMEEWNVGMKKHDLKGSLPILQHSNTPVLQQFGVLLVAGRGFWVL
jgi:hypothetical protein